MSIDMIASVSQLLGVERTFERPRESLAGRLWLAAPGPTLKGQPGRLLVGRIGQKSTRFGLSGRVFVRRVSARFETVASEAIAFMCSILDRT
jgi:hypothetical protein